MATPTPEELQAFEAHVSRFHAISPDDLAQIMQQNLEAFIFLGRPSCSFCRRFAAKLAEIADKTAAKILFLDSRYKADLADFRAQHEIATVPALLHIHTQTVTAVCNSKLSEDEIKAFLKLS